MKNLYLLIGIIAIIFVSGCGSSSNSTPTDPNQLFSTEKFETTSPGIIFTFSLAGSDSDSRKFTGWLSVSNQAEKIIDEERVTPQRSILSLTAENGRTKLHFVFSGSVIRYIKADKSLLILRRDRDTGVTVTCTGTTNVIMPITVKIGDSGSNSTLVCSNNETITSVWIVEDAFDGKVRIAVTSMTRNSSTSKVISTGIEKYTLNSNGDIVALSFSLTILEFGYMLSMHST